MAFTLTQDLIIESQDVAVDVRLADFYPGIN